MRNKLLALLLALCMVMTLLPVMAFADGETCTCSWEKKNPVTDEQGNVTDPGWEAGTCGVCTGAADCEAKDKGGCSSSCKVCSPDPVIPSDPTNCKTCQCAYDECTYCSYTKDGNGGYSYSCGCADPKNGRCTNASCTICPDKLLDCDAPGCVYKEHEGSLHYYECKCPGADCAAAHHTDTISHVLIYQAASEDPNQKCPECRSTGNNDDAPEGHCSCDDSHCSSPSHSGGAQGMIGDKEYGAVCVNIPESGSICDACLASIAANSGNNQDDKKDDEQKPAQPTVDPNAPQKAEDFSDVDAGMWYNDDLTTMLEKGWFVGQAGGKFAPQNATTGAEVVVILSRVAGEDLVTTGSGWNVAATEWAAQQGITDGIEITTSGTLARQDLILMLWRAAGKPASTHALDFTDIEGVSGDALTALRWAVEKGIVKGNGDGTVSPNGATKRCEMAALMVRYDRAVNP